MSSIHTSTQISFKQNICNFDKNNIKKPHMTVFEHIEGSKVYNKLFDDYILPNGKRAYYYYQGGSLVHEIEVPRMPPPEKPLSIPAALQQGMPLTEVLNIIAKPPGRSYHNLYDLIITIKIIIVDVNFHLKYPYQNYQMYPKDIH